jgi:hypothetical protein
VVNALLSAAAIHFGKLVDSVGYLLLLLSSPLTAIFSIPAPDLPQFT